MPVRPLAFAAALLVAPAATAAELTVFAAASLKTAMDEIAPLWERETGHDLTVAHAGSSALARQIVAGAPADAFLSANPGWMDRVEEAGRLAPGTRRDLLTNRLVLVARGTSGPTVELGPDTDLAAMLGDGRLAMALVDAVPAGIYGKAALASLGLWSSVAPRVAQADNVRAALALVATGAAPLGLVYATDAAAEPRVTVVATIPGAAHPPIVYPAAAAAGGDAALAAGFLDWLATDPARAVLRRQGFGVIPE